MLGYIRIEKNNLRFKDYYKYKNYYCALCAVIRKEYGILSCLLLSYDITFLIAVLETIEEYDSKQMIRCPINPLKKKIVNVSDDVFHYCAFINYYLATMKVRDDVHDSRSKYKKILCKLLEHNRKYKSDLSRYKRVINDLEDIYIQVVELEKEKTNIDSLISAFGDFFSRIFTGYLEYKGMELEDPFVLRMKELFCFLGEWVYIMDAYDDLQKDIYKGEYNLLRHFYDEDESATRENFHQYVYVLVFMLLANIKKALSEIKNYRNHDWYLIENICTYGCQMTYTHIKNSRYP